MIQVERYDLRKREDVRNLAEALARESAKELFPVIEALDADSRFIFYAMYLATFAGNMAAAGGVEMSLAVLDRIKETVPSAVASQQAKMN